MSSNTSQRSVWKSVLVCLALSCATANCATKIDNKWHYEVSKDEITDKESFKTRLLTDAPPRGWFEVEATCGSLAVSLQVTYLTGMNNEKDNPGTINHGLNKILVVRMNFDGEVRNARSLPEKFNNAVTFQFAAPNATAKLGDMGVFVDLANALGSAVGAPNPGTSSDLFKSRSIKMEIPLGDGSNPILRIQPQDPEFQKFASQCVRDFPDLASAPRKSPAQPYLDGLTNTPHTNTEPVFRPQPTTVPSKPPATATNIPPDLAVLTIHSTIPGQPSPLARIPFNLMRDDFATTVQRSGIRVQPGTAPPQAFAKICRPSDAACIARLLRASVAGAAATAVSSPTGDATLPPVQPGEYYLLIYGYDANHRNIFWNEKITLTAGANSFTAGMENAKPFR
jgi:hypothetical protein